MIEVIIMIPKFEYWQFEEDGQWYFHLKAPSNGIIVQSVGYNTEYECLQAIEQVKRYAEIAIIDPQNILSAM
jgi:uncharacterized protein YegP (UPF0339 family)